MYDRAMKPIKYQITIDGVLQGPLTARQLADAIELPLEVVKKRLQRGDLTLDSLCRPVGVYLSNAGRRAPTWHERRQATRDAERRRREEDAEIAAANAQVADVLAEDDI